MIFSAGTTKWHRIREQLLHSDLFSDSPAAQGPWKDKIRLVSGLLKNDYLRTLNASRFCLCPRGVTGWTQRLLDALALGCIPVLISDFTVFPFYNLLDYSKFAVFVRECEIPLIADILFAISSPPTPSAATILAQNTPTFSKSIAVGVTRESEMQIAGLSVRNALLYLSPYGHESSPTDLALRSLFHVKNPKPFPYWKWD